MTLPARIRDLTGQRFGRLVVVGLSRRRSRCVIWQTRCDCGRSHLARSWSLVSGQTRSCGCLRSSDLTGQRFGRVVVVELAGKTKHGQTMWLVRCDCGARHITSSHSLRRGNTRSCGCLRREVGVKNIGAHNRRLATEHERR